MEIFWLVVAVATAIFGGIKINEEGLEGNVILLILPFAAALLSGLRRYTRKKLEAREKEKESN